MFARSLCTSLCCCDLLRSLQQLTGPCQVYLHHSRWVHARQTHHENGARRRVTAGSAYLVTNRISQRVKKPYFSINSNKDAILRRAVALQLRMLNAGFAACRSHEGIQLPGLGIAVGLRPCMIHCTLKLDKLTSGVLATCACHHARRQRLISGLHCTPHRPRSLNPLCLQPEQLLIVESAASSE